MDTTTLIIIAAVLLLGPLYLRWLAGMIAAGIAGGLRRPERHTPKAGSWAAEQRVTRRRKPLSDNERIQAEFERKVQFSEDRTRKVRERPRW